MAVTEPEQESQRLIHITPLRYPGGKAKLAPYVKAILKENRLLDGEYVEPYAGGAAVALELLLHEYVSRIHINDVSKPVHAFWKSVLSDTEQFCRLVARTPLTVAQWDKQKRVFENIDDHDDVSVGFAFFFLNRTNRSGILNGGIIGGRDQTGPWKIDARYNARELIQRIQTIARFKDRIRLTRQDALTFLKRGVRKWPEKSLIYLDPPYYLKGRDLYFDFYEHEDHEQVARFIEREIVKQKWIVSYDNVPQINSLYERCRHVVYSIGYSARCASQGSEVMFFSDRLSIPPLTGPIKLTKKSTGKSKRVA